MRAQSDDRAAPSLQQRYVRIQDAEGFRPRDLKAPPQCPFATKTDRCAQTVSGAIACDNHDLIAEFSSAEEGGSGMIRMMIDKPDRVGAKHKLRAFDRRSLRRFFR
jgi:hypothetical protein